MSRGFFDRIADRWRGRWVLPGYNARDANVPRNKVVFDTDDLGTLSLLASGAYTLTGGGIPDVGPVVIGSWADPGYIPLCDFQFSIAGGPRDNAFAMYYFGIYTKNHRITVSRTGITASLSTASSVTIYWTAYRMAVA